MPSINDEELRHSARVRIEQGRLPRVLALHLWGAHGTGSLCALCDQPIGSDQIEYEIQCPVDGDMRTFRFHIDCASAWELERDRLLKKD
jgi:hypothetical protein